MAVPFLFDRMDDAAAAETDLRREHCKRLILLQQIFLFLFRGLELVKSLLGVLLFNNFFYD